MIEQLTLFPEETPVANDDGLEELDDDEGEYQNIADSIGETFEHAMDKRADLATFNWLMRYGLPKSPTEVRFLIMNVPPVMMVWAAKKGYITFNESALATDEEKAKREAEAAPESAFEDAGDSLAQLLTPNFGQYL